MAVPVINLPADLPENWTPDQAVTPDGLSAGLTQQHGYNYLNAAVNASQRAAKTLRDYLAAGGFVGTGDLVNASVTYAKLGSDVKTIISNRGPLPSDVGTPGQRWLDTAHGNVEYTCIAATVGTPNTYKWLYTGGCNPNLLDNWYFVGGGSQQGGGQFPINQLGQTSYNTIATSIYTIDRWKGTYGNALIVSSDCIERNGGGKISQKVEDNLPTDVPFTVSLLCRCNDMTVIIYFSDYSSITQELSNHGGLLPNTDELLQWTFTPTKKISEIGFSQTSQNDLCKHYAAKLELGDRQTLAHQDENGNWVLNEVPNFQQELAKCQRYQFPLRSSGPVPIGTSVADGNGAISIRYELPVPMRTTPSMVPSTQTFRIHGPSVDYVNAVPNAYPADDEHTALYLYFSGFGGVPNEPYFVDGYPSVNVMFDANLE